MYIRRRSPKSVRFRQEISFGVKSEEYAVEMARNTANIFSGARKSALLSFSVELTEPGGAHAEFGCKVGGEVRVIGKTAKFADFVNGHIGVLQQRFCIVHSVTHDA